MHPLPLTGTETSYPVEKTANAAMHPIPLTGTAKKGFPGHWSGKSFFTDLIEMMIFFYAFAAGHPLARSFFIAALFAMKIIFKNFSINPEFSPPGDES